MVLLLLSEKSRTVCDIQFIDEGFLRLRENTGVCKMQFKLRS